MMDTSDVSGVRAVSSSWIERRMNGCTIKYLRGSSHVTYVEVNDTIAFHWEVSHTKSFILHSSTRV